METTEKLNTPSYVTNMKMVAWNMWVFYLKLSAYNAPGEKDYMLIYPWKIIPSFLIDTYPGFDLSFGIAVVTIYPFTVLLFYA